MFTLKNDLILLSFTERTQKLLNVLYEKFEYLLAVILINSNYSTIEPTVTHLSYFN